MARQGIEGRQWPLKYRAAARARATRQPGHCYKGINQKGMQQGEALALQRLLGKRFGALPPAISTRIAAASVEEIESWFDHAIDARQLDDVFGDTAAH
jgi:Domain of unknown function (DUF4351)